jgi:hypothetical protein
MTSAKIAATFATSACPTIAVTTTAAAPRDAAIAALAVTATI